MNAKQENDAREVLAPGPNLEDSLVGTWFARLGVLAVLIGAAFGYRYAVDQGLIGPAARVTLGALTGIAFLVWGHWARARAWASFSHAVSAGGIAILYLAVLAALIRYELISPALGLVLLTGVALLSAWLAVMYDAFPFALLATVGAFMNPFFISGNDPDPTSALSYVVAIDVGIVTLAYFKRWSSLTRLALVGTVALFAFVAPEVGVVEGLGFATILWVLFTMVAFLQVLVSDQSRGPALYMRLDVIESITTVAVGFLYFGTGMYFLEQSGPRWQGGFVIALALAYAGLAFVARMEDKTRVLLPGVMGALSGAFAILAPAILADGRVVTLTWAAQGSVLLYLAGRLRETRLTVPAAALAFVGVMSAVDAVATHAPDRLLTSPSSLVIVGHIIVLYADLWLLSKMEPAEEWQQAIAPVLGILGNLLTLGWLSREAMFEIDRTVASSEAYEVRQFAFSALWALYSALVLAIGVARRQPWLRYFALGLFGLTIAKMVSVDLWQLEVLQRTVAFVGLGAVLLACSVMYNRFRDLIVGPRESRPAPEGQPST